MSNLKPTSKKENLQVKKKLVHVVHSESNESDNESNDELDNKIDEISNELDVLNKSTKLKDILKKHKQIKNNLDDVYGKVKTIKTIFENIDSKKDSNKDDNKDIIDDATYDKYTKDINEIIKTINDKKLENQIAKYKILSKKVIACENYLKSKKMEIIECPDEDEKSSDVTESSTSS